MRKILFRGKSVNNGEWIYSETLSSGTIKRKRYNKYLEIFGKWRGIVPDTLGQFTGLLDKNGKKSFEGDIVVHNRNEWRGKYNATGAKHYEKVSSVHEVYFDTEMLEFGLKNSSALFHCQFANEFEIIGNITDNPELLNE